MPACKTRPKELKLKQAGLRATLEVNDGTPSGQLEKLQQFNSQSDIVGVGVSALDADNVAVVEELRKLQKKGVQVVTVDSDVGREKFRDCRFAFIGTDNRVGGRELGACAKGLRPAGGGYVTFVGRTGAQNAIERIEGFKEGAGPRFQSLDSMADDTDRARARDNVRNAIQNHKDKLKVLVGIWSYNAPAIADVVKELGQRKDFTIVVFDAEPIAIQQIAAGYIDAMVVQNPYEMGYQGVRLMKALHEKRPENRARDASPPRTAGRGFVRHGAQDRRAQRPIAADARVVRCENRVPDARRVQTVARPLQSRRVIGDDGRSSSGRS